MSDLPALLQSRLQDAQTYLERVGEVSIWHRQAVYGALGPSTPRPLIDLNTLSPHERKREEQRQQRRAGLPPVQFPRVFGANRTIGHLRRTWLSILLVEHLLPIWERDWYPLGNRTRGTVPRLLVAVRQIYAGEQLPATSGDGRISLSDAYNASDMVHYVAGRAYEVAIFDAEYQLYPLPLFQHDDMLSDLRNDIAWIAALAMKPDDIAFWEWWLDEAIPAAWRAHPDPPVPPGRGMKYAWRGA